jgi:hypothetical protein
MSTKSYSGDPQKIKNTVIGKSRDIEFFYGLYTNSTLFKLKRHTSFD